MPLPCVPLAPSLAGPFFYLGATAGGRHPHRPSLGDPLHGNADGQSRMARKTCQLSAISDTRHAGVATVIEH